MHKPVGPNISTALYNLKTRSPPFSQEARGGGLTIRQSNSYIMDVDFLKASLAFMFPQDLGSAQKTNRLWERVAAGSTEARNEKQ